MKRILLVDDDVAILRGLKPALTREGYDVLTTSNPTEVSELISREAFDLIILDVRMPAKSGVEVFDELKKINPDMRFLFITAFLKSFSVESNAMLKRWQELLPDGNTDVLYKPFKLDDLYLKVEGLIGPGKGG